MSTNDGTGANSELKCTQVATMDTDVHIRHVKALKIRRPRWLVSEHDLPDPLLGRPLLYSLGLDVQKTLAAVSYKYAGTFFYGENHVAHATHRRSS